MTTGGKSRITSIQLGEATVSLLDGTKLSGTFALMRGDGERVGRTTKAVYWSEATMKLLSSLANSMEVDMLESIFEVEPSSPTANPDEPKQI